MESFLDKIGKAVLIIAEIGNNHNGDIETAKRLVDIAVAAKVDAVKFQTFRGVDIVTPLVQANEYEGWDTKGYEYWYEFLDSIALPLESHREVFEYAITKGVIPFSTPTSPYIVEFLEGLNVPFYKIASMDVTNIQLIKAVAATGKPVILSTGMSNEEEIAAACKLLEKNELCIMHCISDYPTDYSNANLASIQFLKSKFGVPVGFSDHSLGTELSVAAVAMGARVIEKHITISRNTDKKAEHHFALEPGELKALVDQIRNVEVAIGEVKLLRSKAEKVNKLKYRRSLHVNKTLTAGHVLETSDMVVLRPGDGANPSAYDDFIGKKLSYGKKAWESIDSNDVEL
jgi:sialic acid synthase SpsE